ncbi:hypothetical protein ACIG0A_33445 [Streptomyces californicus]|uniref:hypothetical protein n=1 Tax=Streptomyces californicus TaxID=67351 RepID=UPI0037CF36E2
MTTQPRIALDDLTSDALDSLHARLDAAEARVRELEAEVAHYEEVVVGDLNEANIRLQREVTRLTAGHSEGAAGV